MSTAPEPSPAAGATSVEDVMDLVACRYVDFPEIGTIDLDTPELPSNDREMLEVATERMFSEPSILDTITSVASAMRQYEGVGGSAPPAVPEAAEGVLEESAADAESAVIVPVPSPTREGQDASLPQSAEAVASASAAMLADMAGGVVGEAGPSSPCPVAAVAEDILVSGEPVVVPQECVAPEVTRATSLEIQEAEEDSGAALSQGATSSGAQALELACTRWAAAFEVGDGAKDDDDVAACNTLERGLEWVLTVYFGTPNMFITLWSEFDYGTNPPLGTLII
jgi:hypothetical protein